MTPNDVQKIATDAATKVYNRLGTQYDVPKVPVHSHTGTDTLKVDYNDLTSQLTASSPLTITPGTGSPNLSITLPASIPTGTILMYGSFTSIPTGYLLCDGNSYARATYPDLFAVIGTSFGAVDGTHFDVPYTSGRVPVGATTNSGLGGGASGSGTRPTGGNTLTQYNVGDWEGEETHVLTEAELAAHTHVLNLPLSVPTGAGASSGVGPTTGGVSTSPQSIASDGSNSPHNTIQPVLAFAFIIKY